ncbi:MAG: GIY-YIG nuclease family protein [Magnetospirillum sp.]|nr:GIY-YIG nuclease family protein [Magnetospirillum sp.]
MRDHHYYVYLMASLSRTLYVGVTNDLRRRVSEHKAGLAEGFTKRYGCHRLVWFEYTNDISGAILREKQIKAWRREKKCALINAMNPEWRDLSEDF